MALNLFHIFVLLSFVIWFYAFYAPSGRPVKKAELTRYSECISSFLPLSIKEWRNKYIYSSILNQRLTRTLTILQHRIPLKKQTKYICVGKLNLIGQTWESKFLRKMCTNKTIHTQIYKAITFLCWLILVLVFAVRHIKRWGDYVCETISDKASPLMLKI